MTIKERFLERVRGALDLSPAEAAEFPWDDYAEALCELGYEIDQMEDNARRTIALDRALRGAAP